MRTLSLLLLALALGVALPACGDDDDDGGGGDGGEPAVADLGRYCALSKELDEAGTEAFRELEQDPEAKEEDFEAVEREFVEAHEQQLEEIVAVAPAEIKDDIGVLLSSIRGRAGLGPEVPESESNPAEERVTAFEEENCPK